MSVFICLSTVHELRGVCEAELTRRVKVSEEKVQVRMSLVAR